MFYEVSEKDVELDDMTRKRSLEPGVNKWVTEGVTIFKWDSRFQHMLRPHRFAMRPNHLSQIDWKIFNPNKYYIHVYQTKIDIGSGDLRTLQSRSIAQYLFQNWNSQYWPRTVDINLLERPDRNFSGIPIRPQTSSYRKNGNPQELPSEASTYRTNFTAGTMNSSTRRRRLARLFDNANCSTDEAYNSEKSWRQLRKINESGYDTRTSTVNRHSQSRTVRRDRGKQSQ